jgi:hypothetical protein
MNQPTTSTPISLPFGKHRGLPLAQIPADYLSWLLGAAKLSTGLRGAVAAELTRRGVSTPPAPPRARMPACWFCGSGRVRFDWLQDTIGRRQLTDRSRATGSPAGRDRRGTKLRGGGTSADRVSAAPARPKRPPHILR